MGDGEKDGRRVNVWKVDQGRSRCGMSKIEREDESGRSWSGAVDMF